MSAGAFQRNSTNGAFKRYGTHGSLRRNTASTTRCCCNCNTGTCGTFCNSGTIPDSFLGTASGVDVSVGSSCYTCSPRSYKFFGAGGTGVTSFCLSWQGDCEWRSSVGFTNTGTVAVYSDTACTTVASGGGTSVDGLTLFRVAGKWILKSYYSDSSGTEWRTFYGEVSASDPSACDGSLSFTNAQTSFGCSFDPTLGVSGLWVFRQGINGSIQITPCCL